MHAIALAFTFRVKKSCAFQCPTLLHLHHSLQPFCTHRISIAAFGSVVYRGSNCPQTVLHPPPIPIHMVMVVCRMAQGQGYCDPGTSCTNCKERYVQSTPIFQWFIFRQMSRRFCATTAVDFGLHDTGGTQH